MTVFLPRGSAVIRHAPPIALLPRRLALWLEPRRGADGSTVQGSAAGVPDPRAALDGTPARQDMRGVGARASAGVEPRACATAVQAGIESALCGGPQDHTGPTRAEDRTVEAGGRARSTQGLRPIDPTTHGLGSLTIGDIFDGWHHGDQRQPPRGFARLSACREQGGTRVIGDARAQLITPHAGHVPMGHSSPGDTCRLLGDRWDRWRME